MSEAEYEITRLGGKPYIISKSSYDKDLVNPIIGIEKYLLGTNGKFKHLHKRNTKYSWTKSRFNDIVTLYLNEELNTTRKTYFKRCKLIQEDFNRFKKWIRKQNNRDMEWY